MSCLALMDHPWLLRPNIVRFIDIDSRIETSWDSTSSSRRRSVLQNRLRRSDLYLHGIGWFQVLLGVHLVDALLLDRASESAFLFCLLVDIRREFLVRPDILLA